MDAPRKEKAEGAGAPSALDCGATGNPKDTRTPEIPQRDGTRAAGAHLGTALRHAREAVSLNLRHGPSRRLRREAILARNALDSVVWVCDYVEADR